MPLSIALLVLASALAHATTNAILKRSKDPENAIVAMMAITAISSVLIAFVRGTAMPSRAGIVWSVVSGLFEALYFSTLARAFVRAPLGSAYTIIRGGALI